MGRRILVVDDNRDSATTLSMLLQILGHKTDTAFDGLKALDAAEVFQPELVILDISLPGIDGYEVARRLRERPWSESVVIVASTGWDYDQLSEAGTASCFDDYLRKPVQLEELQQIVDRLPTESVSQPV